MTFWVSFLSSNEFQVRNSTLSKILKCTFGDFFCLLYFVGDFLGRDNFCDGEPARLGDWESFLEYEEYDEADAGLRLENGLGLLLIDRPCSSLSRYAFVLPDFGRMLAAECSGVLSVFVSKRTCSGVAVPVALGGDCGFTLDSVFGVGFVFGFGLDLKAAEWSGLLD